jgi:hypothetical protein
MVRKSKFLMGQADGIRGPFRCTLHWLLRPSNFAKVLNGHYQDAQEAQGTNNLDRFRSAVRSAGSSGSTGNVERQEGDE